MSTISALAMVFLAISVALNVIAIFNRKSGHGNGHKALNIGAVIAALVAAGCLFASM